MVGCKEKETVRKGVWSSVRAAWRLGIETCFRLRNLLSTQNNGLCRQDSKSSNRGQWPEFILLAPCKSLKHGFLRVIWAVAPNFEYICPVRRDLASPHRPKLGRK